MPPQPRAEPNVALGPMIAYLVEVVLRVLRAAPARFGDRFLPFQCDFAAAVERRKNVRFTRCFDTA